MNESLSILGVQGLTQAGGLMFACFFASVFLLDYFDISLPRGDSIAVSGAVTAAAILVLGPVPAALACSISAVLAQTLRGGFGWSRRLGSTLASRLVALSIGTLVLFAVVEAGFPARGLLAEVLVPGTFLVGELAAAQASSAIATGRPFARLLSGNLTVQAPLLLAQWSASVLLLITLPTMGIWGLAPVVALLFLMRQSYAMLLDIRETYRTTVEVLVEAAEGQDQRLTGHSERTAEIARSIAMHCGVPSNRIELISYAALLHDIDAISDCDSESLDGSETVLGRSSAVLEGAHFFDEVTPILRVCDGDVGPGSDASDADRMAGFIVALASDADAAATPDVAAAHPTSAVARVAPNISRFTKSQVVASALALGYKIPAVS